MGKRKNPTPYQQLCSSITLHNAWKQICENGLQSDSKATKAEILKFKENERGNVDKIYRQLQKQKFEFKKNKGILLGDKKRPIVLASVESRIVQRAILDVLQAHPGMQKYLRSKGSYGALKSFADHEKGVPAAIKDLALAVDNGADTYYKSDIAKFFTQIPRAEVVKIIADVVRDDDFISILEKATNLEIDNVLSLPEGYRKFFDFNTTGTPQGCCLSPLLGNILLFEFDQTLNQNGITCLRYLDDFIIVGIGWKAVSAAFAKAETILKALGLDTYKLNDGSGKALSGTTNTLFEFLGVEFKDSNIRPSKKSRQKLLSSIQQLCDDSMATDFNAKATRDQREASLVTTLHTINYKVLGWGNQYAFCNEEALWGSIDAEIDSLLKAYLGRYAAKRVNLDGHSRRRMLGVHLISESKKEPIVRPVQAIKKAV